MVAAVTGLMEIGEAIRRLGERTPEIVQRLYPAASIEKHRAFIGDVHGNPGRSMSISFEPDPKTKKRGNWRDWAADQGGDILDLVAIRQFNGDKKAALRWAKDFLGIQSAPDHIRNRVPPAPRGTKSLKPPKPKKEFREIAWRIWGVEALPDLTDTPVAHYLAERGIDIDAQPISGAIRYHPDCLDGETGVFYPAMVTAMAVPEPRKADNGTFKWFQQVHRTYLEQGPDGRWGKADLGLDKAGKRRSAKSVLGSGDGGYISISRGASGKRLKQAPLGDRVMICEGIEDALHLARAFPDWRVIAAATMGNMAALWLPETIRTIQVWADNDDKPDARAAFERVQDKIAEKWGDRDLSVVRVPDQFKDISDAVRGIAKPVRTG